MCAFFHALFLSHEMNSPETMPRGPFKDSNGRNFLWNFVIMGSLFGATWARDLLFFFRPSQSSSLSLSYKSGWSFESPVWKINNDVSNQHHLGFNSCSNLRLSRRFIKHQKNLVLYWEKNKIQTKWWTDSKDSWVKFRRFLWWRILHNFRNWCIWKNEIGFGKQFFQPEDLNTVNLFLFISWAGRINKPKVSQKSFNLFIYLYIHCSYLSLGSLPNILCPEASLPVS